MRTLKRHRSASEDILVENQVGFRNTVQLIEYGSFGMIDQPADDGAKILGKFVDWFGGLCPTRRQKPSDHATRPDVATTTYLAMRRLKMSRMSLIASCGYQP